MTTTTEKKINSGPATPATDKAKPANADQAKRDLQGEGNYEAAREFNTAERKFVSSGKVADAARAAAPKTEAERKSMADAEAKGRSHSKGEDPAGAGSSDAAATSNKDGQRKPH
jgi:hypothetical protein